MPKSEKLNKLHRLYEESVIDYGSEYLLPFSQALAFAEDAYHLGLMFSGCGFWYNPENELPDGPKGYVEEYNLEDWVPEEITPDTPDAIKISYESVISFITDLEGFMSKNPPSYFYKPQSMPDFVSFVFEEIE